MYIPSSYDSTIKLVVDYLQIAWLLYIVSGADDGVAGIMQIFSLDMESYLIPVCLFKRSMLAQAAFGYIVFVLLLLELLHLAAGILHLALPLGQALLPRLRTD